MDVTIRQMIVEDIPTIHEMARKEEGFQVAEAETSCFWSQEQLIQWVKAGEDVLLVAEVDGEIAGFILTTLHRPTGKATWENELTLPQYRGKGVAKALETEMVNQLREKGATYIHFLVKMGNQHLAHYRHMGFGEGYNFTWFGKNL